MTQATNQPLYELQLRPKDIGVALLAILCLLGGWLLMQNTITRTQAFTPTAEAPLAFNYPVGWIAKERPENVLLRVSNPDTASAFKTTLTVEGRLIDPTNPPTLQSLLDRRVQERQSLPSYHFLSETETEVAGARAMRSDFAYVAQPIDEARRDALPVVVRASEYIIVTADQSYYITLAAPEAEYASESGHLDRLISSLQVQQ